MFIQGYLQLNKDKELINALNVFPVPDGDTGTNMSMTLSSVLDDLKNSTNDSVEVVAKIVSKGSLMGARGNSGVILSQIFRGFSKGLEGSVVLDVKTFSNALKSASDTSYKAVMRPVEGTILTVVRNTAEKAIEIQDEDLNFHDYLKILIERANQSLDKTPDYLPVLKQANVVDAGGKGFVSILNGFYNAIVGKELEDIKSEPSVKIEHEKYFSKADIEFQYCTEFIIDNTKKKDLDVLKEDIQAMGDSLVFVVDENIVKVHIHTNDPGIALQKALEYGDLLTTKIENMIMQHENHIIEVPSEPAKAYGFISVSVGSGLDEVFKDLGVDVIISGGQTMNPSTEDFMEAIEKIKANDIFIFPNNSNIILAATQAKDLSMKNVHVIQTKNIPQGINSLISFNEMKSVDENVEIMNDSLSNVDSLSVTYSVRDTTFDGNEIEKDDYLGILNNKIASSGKDVYDVIKNAILSMEKEIDLITIFYGQDVSEQDANKVKEVLENLDFGFDIELHYGGQPIYYYLMSIE
jgi:DAK2 domain fusion protein YloV